ncbi:hypothetical protein L2E82_08128 [Cichorium intybus]|uniref:Uncharacterized protein n=1 Tax=Cichorium intybus TaxID=13427 RepID=A0ACB9G6Q8_CICIN|nr:hypothetical protein L2E82_08128 [Cichorium intybus]
MFFHASTSVLSSPFFLPLFFPLAFFLPSSYRRTPFVSVNHRHRTLKAVAHQLLLPVPPPTLHSDSKIVECGITAMLIVEDDEFWLDVACVKFGDLPAHLDANTFDVTHDV